MEIDLGQGVSFIIKYKGSEYKLSEPKFDQVTMFEKELADEASSKDDCIYKFLHSLGMPMEVLKEMGILTLTKLANGISESFNVQKKT